jgi:putative two-component system response regulator
VQRWPACCATIRATPPRPSTSSYIDDLSRSAPLHDIGKVGIPDHILLKPGQAHARGMDDHEDARPLGSDAIEQAEQDIDQPVEFLALAKEIARWHHEKWDGSGYPDGLGRDDIPVSARLMAWPMCSTR